MTSSIKQYRAVDFFCGGGGMTFGLRQAGIQVVAGLDIDMQCKETYEYNNPGSCFLCEDISRLSVETLENRFSIHPDDDSMVFIGCSPCQYYSVIRTQKNRSLKTKDLLLEFQKFIRYYRPGYVLVENVPGILTNEKTVLNDFLKFLSENGYNHVHYEVINMKDYGIPQTRRRFLLIATRLNREVSLPEKQKKVVCVSDVLGEAHGFPRIKAGTHDSTEFFHSVCNLSLLNQERLKRTPHDGGTRMAWKDNTELQLPCYQGKDSSFRDVYGRMYWNRPSPTITTKFFNISNGRFAHPDEDRAISIREGATLQTFPFEYVFKTESLGTAARIIGNAVPPEYARQLGMIILNEKRNENV